MTTQRDRKGISHVVGLADRPGKEEERACTSGLVVASPFHL